MPFDENAPPRIFCTACGMPHHEDCYQENGGCTVFGCPRAPADDPKLQVSYSDLNALTGARPQMIPTAGTVTPQNVAPLPQFPSPYGGPLGLSQPAGASAQATAPAQVPVPADRAAAPPLAGPSSGTPAIPAYVSALPAQLQPTAASQRQPRSRTTFIVLGIFFGALGVHNFYAGYTGRAVGQLCLSVLTLFYLAIASWVWAIVEICVVDRDSTGIQFT